jgi:hypothetical protein
MVQRYGLICLIAAPLGFGLGALLYALMVLTCNQDW